MNFWAVFGRVDLCASSDFPDFTVFADYWLESGSGLPADLDTDGDVDLDDLKLFVDDWLCGCPYNWPLR